MEVGHPELPSSIIALLYPVSGLTDRPRICSGDKVLVRLIDESISPAPLPSVKSTKSITVPVPFTRPLITVAFSPRRILITSCILLVHFACRYLPLDLILGRT